MGAPKLHRSYAPPAPKHLKLVLLNGGSERLPVLDLIRGIGIVLMIFFHVCFDLKTFASTPPKFVTQMPAWFWNYFPEMIGTIFFFCLGASARLANESKDSGQKTLRRFLVLSTISIGITAGTAVFTPALTIYFGVIHCMAICVLLMAPLLNKPYLSLYLGVLSILAGVWMRSQTFSFSYLFWMGFYSEAGPMGGDNYPLFPWIGVALCGVSVASFYHQAARKFPADSWLLKPLRKLGQHSLLIYLLHQPLLILAITSVEAISKK